MSNLFVHLPSFATDYSGAASVFYNMGGLVVIHEPSGCMGNFTGFDEPRWYHAPEMVFSSFIREEEATMGDESILLNKILQECASHHPKFVAILGTPVPALIGCDISGIATEVFDTTKIPAFGLNTTGFQYYDDGIKKALLMIEEQLMKDSEVKEPKTVNILGYTPIDFFLSGDDRRLASFVESCGFRILCSLPGDELETIIKAPNAEKNIVVSAAAIPLAEKMREKYGIPFCAMLPGTTNGKERMQAFLQDYTPQLPASCVCSGKALVIGEQISANTIRDFLIEDLNYSNVNVATFFAFSRTIAREGDIKLSNEGHLQKLIEEGCYDIIVGDPLFERFTNRQQIFVSLPHPAVSSKLHWQSYVSLLSNDFSKYLYEKINRKYPVTLQ
ncbi:oxidoreductase/nitrogenase, component 1 [Methanocorpusculum labreanum Z]|uniref:Oxidoreductase/nitrogenase, component 1 n=1 Tax=Methanocorpusculum labreanum (strain ATCC 43576 / DSM 4855 / Z) TaxID=410358 RepID=A2SSA2_METLZ|nr:nitrogenase component 1 [Methanocorpusculum labreanum]ABN07208.1 oxidoreductase/nitrogenase, component 1 [Methanocorpusculum labreanum Z]